VVGPDTFTSQQIVNAAIAEAPASMSEIDDARLERHRLRVFSNYPPKRRSGKPHKPAGASLGNRKLLAHLQHRLALGLRD
jgi:hypothetical protein